MTIVNCFNLIRSPSFTTTVLQVSDYFSYEHFYVIYCKFWEIDTDHDLIINLQDISRHADSTVNPFALERLFQGTVSG